MKIPVAEAKARFADLIRRAEAGEEIELTRYGRPVARLVATPGQAGGLVGCMKGSFPVPGSDAETDAEIAALFTGSP